MSSGQNSQDETNDLVRQLDEWARLNEGVSFGDPTTVALCRAAATMLRGDEASRRTQPTADDLRSIARAILEQRARLEQLPAAEEGPDETAPSPVPLARRQLLTMEAMDGPARGEDGPVDDEPVVEEPLEDDFHIGSDHDAATLEAAEDLEPEEDRSFAAAGASLVVEAASDDEMPWYALPATMTDDDEPRSAAAASQRDIDQMIDWHEDDGPADGPDSGLVHHDRRSGRGRRLDDQAFETELPEDPAWAAAEPADNDDSDEATGWSDHPMPDDDELAPIIGRGDGRDAASANEAALPVPGAGQTMRSPGSLFPPRQDAGPDLADDDWDAEPPRLKPSLEDEIARLVALLDAASNPVPPPPPPAPPAPSQASIPGVRHDAGPTPRVSRMMHAANGARQSTPAPAMTLSMYRKPLREELNVCLDELRIFNFG